MHKKGISLIALVLTLIILLILAAISIGIFIGRDRLITNAMRSKFTAAKAETKDRIVAILANETATGNYKYGWTNFKMQYIKI